MPDELDNGQFDGSAVGTSDRLGVEVGSVDGVEFEKSGAIVEGDNFVADMVAISVIFRLEPCDGPSDGLVVPCTSGSSLGSTQHGDGSGKNFM